MLNDEQMRTIMEDYADYLTQLSYMYVKDWATAEDIVQESFIKYFKQPEKFEMRGSLKTYLSRIVINGSMDYLRSWKSRVNTWKNVLLHTKHSKSEPLDADIILAIEQTELLKYVLALQVKYREVITLFYYEDMTTNEISQLLMVPENTVKTRLKRAREQLKLKLTDADWEVLYNE